MSEFQVENKLNEVSELISNTLNPEGVAFWQIVYSLSKEAKSWSQLRKEIGVSKPILSKKLKRMQELPFPLVKRTVVPAFPPRTRYELDQRAGLDVLEYLKTGSRAIRFAQDWTETALRLSLKKEIPTQEVLEDLLHTLELVVVTVLKNYVESPMGDPSVLSNIWGSTFSTVFIMQCFWGTYESLTVSDERRTEALKLLSTIIKEKTESYFPSPREREILSKVLEPFERGNNPQRAITPSK